MNYSIINDLILNFAQDLKQKTTYCDISVYVFPQNWTTTALGYAELGGSAMTTANTIVLYAQDMDIVRVYFGSTKLAYEIANPNQLFFQDLSKHQLAEQSEYKKYYNED